MNPPPLPFLLIFTRSPNARHREQSVFFSMKGILFFFFFKQVRLLLLSRIIGFSRRILRGQKFRLQRGLLVPFLRRRETSPPLSEERPRNEARFKFNLTLSRVKRHDNEPLTTDYNNNHGGGKAGEGDAFEVFREQSCKAGPRD